MIKWVAFDIDNTLYDYDYCHSRAMGKLAEYAGQRYSMKREEFAARFSAARETVKKRLGNTAAAHNRLLYIQTFLEQAGEKPAAEGLSMYEVYWGAMLREMSPYPYVLPLMRELVLMGIRLGIITDLTAHIQHRKLRCLGADGLVDIIVTSEEAGEEKPSPAPFSLFLEKAGVCPGEVLMIGDSPQKDIAGAEAAGLHALLFTRERAEDMTEICMGRIAESKRHDF